MIIEVELAGFRKTILTLPPQIRLNIVPNTPTFTTLKLSVLTLDIQENRSNSVIPL
jgi:hypothetical protein